MLKFRRILRENVVARFFVYLFICNFFTCQCFAMTPTEVLVDNFRGNMRSLFSTFNEEDNLGLVLTHEKETNRYSLEAIRSNNFGELARQKLSSQIIHNEHTGEDTLDFGYGFMFSIMNGVLCFNQDLNGFSGYFQTNADVLISSFHFSKSFLISANAIRVENELSTGNSLTLMCRSLLNEGMIFSPFLSVRASNLENAGSILGNRIIIESDNMSCEEKSSINGSEILDIASREKIECNNSSLTGKNLRISSAQMEVTRGSEISGRENIDFTGSGFCMDKDSRVDAGKSATFMTYLFQNEGEMSVSQRLDVLGSVFLNEGRITAGKADVFVTKENALFGPLSLSRTIEVFEYIASDRRIGSFVNIGKINAETLSIIAERYLLNRGVLSVYTSLDLSGEAGFANDGYIIQTGLRNAHSRIFSKGGILNKEGSIELAGHLNIDGESFDNTHGTLKAKQLKMRLSIGEGAKFEENEKEHVNLQSETNVHSGAVQVYLRTNRRLSKPKSASSDGDKTSGQDSEDTSTNKEGDEKRKTLAPEIGYLVNTGGVIEVLRNLDINSSGAVYNAEGGKITAKDIISMNIYGRLLNQLGSKISAHSMTVCSQGRVFNTGGSIMEGLLSFSSDGFENGTGSKVLGSLDIVSQGSIYNFGEIVSIENPLQVVTDFSIGNYGSMSSSEKITLTARGNVKNIGSMSSKSIELHIGTPGIVAISSLPFAMKNGSITATDLIFECFVTTPVASAVLLSDLVQNAGIEAEEVKFLFPNATLENQSDNILKFRSTIFAKEFRNLALLRSLKPLAIFTSQQLINAASDSALNPSATEGKVKTFRLLDDYDIGKQEELRRHLTTNKIDCLQDRAENNARIIVEGDLSILSDGSIKNTGSIETLGHLSVKAKQLQHGQAYDTQHHESLPDGIVGKKFDFTYDFMETQPSYIRARQGAEITAAKFLNTFGIIDVVGGLVSNNTAVFLNYAGDINVRGEAQITTPLFANLIGTVKTSRADKRYWSLEFCNTNPASFNVLGGRLSIDSPHAINSGSFLYGQDGVLLNGVATDQLVSVFDVASQGFGYTRMFSVNEYNRGQYADKILGMGYTSTGLGAIIRAELNETVRKKILPASVTSSKKVIIDGYKDLRSNGIIHGASIGIKTGDGTTELGYTGDAILPSITGFAKSVEVYPYISALAQEGQFELADETDNFLFKSRAGGMKIPFTIIDDGQTDLSKLKLPFSLEVLEVMALKQMQRSLGTGYLSDMPTFLDAARVAHGLIKGGREARGFPFLRDYTEEPIKVISEDQAIRGLFFHPRKLGDQMLLFPELRLSSDLVHSALLNPAGATVAQGGSNANVVIDTDGFLHATASIHADDSIKVRAKRGALFETTTYDAMAITQNITATTSRSGIFGLNSDTQYHKLSEWHQVKRAREPMLATTTRGDFIIVLPDDEETAEFKGMFADIAGNFEVYGGNCVLSPLELAEVVKCPGLFGGGANRISTMLPVFLKTVLKSKGDFLADVRVFKNTASKIEALGDIVINATDRIEFNTETRKFTLAEGMEVDEGTFTTRVSSRKVEDVVFTQPEAKAGGDIKFNSDTVHLTGQYESEEDIKINARLATLESVLGYGTDEFYSRASNMFASSSYDRFATFARVAPTVIRSHGDFIADILELYSEHSVQKSCRDERITARDIDSSALRAKETVIEHSSSSGFNFFIPTSVVAPVCDGNIRQAIDAFWKESSLLTTTQSLLHSHRGAEIAANGISTALSAYSSIKTVLDFKAGGFASLFGIGDIGFYHSESRQNTTHEFTIGSTTMASGNIEWRARTGDIRITHRLAESGGNQSYTAAGRIEVNPGEDVVRTDGHTISCNGTFNVFTKGMSFGINDGTSSSSTRKYLASGFKSQGTNVFRAGNGISIVIPQIEGSRNVFDAVLVSLENKANEREVHSESHGVTISTNPLEAVALTAGANFGVEDSHETQLNDAYIRGAVDFVHSQVRNQGCLVMDIENAGASYEYIPGHEVHDSTSFAIGLSGLDLTSADAFAYSLGKAMASSAASMGVGMLASEAGLGGFVSTIAASLAGTYVNTEVLPQQRDATHNPVGLGTNSTVSFEHSGQGFNAVNLEFNRAELDAIINKIRENIFNEALEQGLSTEQAVQQVHEAVEQFSQEVEVERAKFNETVSYAEGIQTEIETKIREVIGNEDTEKIKKGEAISKEKYLQVAQILRDAGTKIKRKQVDINFRSPIASSKVQKASLKATNEVLDGLRTKYAKVERTCVLQVSNKEDVSFEQEFSLLRRNGGLVGQHFGKACGIVCDGCVDLYHRIRDDSGIQAFLRHWDKVPAAVWDLSKDELREWKTDIKAFLHCRDYIMPAANSLWNDYINDRFADGPIEGTAKVALDICSLFTLRNISKSAPQKFDAALGEEFGVYGKASARNLHARFAQAFVGRRAFGFEMKNSLYQRVQNAAETINGRLYTGHALDQMRNRGIFPCVVENAIRTGIRTQSASHANRWIFTDTVNRVRVIVEKGTNEVITVTFGK